jgi:hypothetical protein
MWWNGGGRRVGRGGGRRLALHCASIEMHKLIHRPQRKKQALIPADKWYVPVYKTNENSVPGNLYVKYMLMFMCLDE